MGLAAAMPEYNIHSFNSRRSPVFANNGMVAAAHPLATLAGLEILKRGGNAIDASIAAAAMLGVAQPYQTGLGGDAFALIYNADTKRVIALNASGPSPAAATLELLSERGLSVVPARHPISWTVPGAVDGWWQMSQKHGRLAWPVLFEAAIFYADNGFPVTPCDCAAWRLNEELLRADTHSAHYFLIGGRVPSPGDNLVQPDLAATLRRLAAGGREEFYAGSTAEAILEAAAACGAVIAERDLRAYTAEWQTPIEVSYRGHRILECPPNGQGLAALVALQALSEVNLPAERDSAVGWHLLIEATKFGMVTAAAHVADPRWSEVPVGRLLSERYVRGQFVGDNNGVASEAGIAAAQGSDTVYLAAVDGDGNAVSFINSVYDDFGSGHAIPRCGFVMQSRGRGFVVDSKHPNCFGPRKRPYHTIMPGMAFNNDKLFAVFGVTGGFMQPQGHVQLVVNLLDYGMDVQSAIDYPRFWWEERKRVVVEEGLPESLYSSLRAMGHEVSRRTHHKFGGGQAIIVDRDRKLLIGGSEPRQDGCALGY
jgi:gamma-glutamyltranspeptidase / glutathione hydrolase